MLGSLKVCLSSIFFFATSTKVWAGWYHGKGISARDEARLSARIYMYGCMHVSVYVSIYVLCVLRLDILIFPTTCKELVGFVFPIPTFPIIIKVLLLGLNVSPVLLKSAVLPVATLANMG